MEFVIGSTVHSRTDYGGNRPNTYNQKGLICNYCGKYGHESRNCSQKLFCTHCRITGHNFEACRSKNLNRPNHANRGPNLICERCGQPGHATLNCQMNQGQHGIPMQQQAINVDRSQNQNSAQCGFQNVAPGQIYQNSAQYGVQNAIPQQFNPNSAQYGFQYVAPQQFNPNSAQYGYQNVNPQQIYQSSAPNKPGNSYQTASIHANPEN